VIYLSTVLASAVHFLVPVESIFLIGFVSVVCRGGTPKPREKTSGGDGSPGPGTTTPAGTKPAAKDGDEGGIAGDSPAAASPSPASASTAGDGAEVEKRARAVDSKPIRGGGVYVPPGRRVTR
jgi:hypothetical protein